MNAIELLDIISKGETSQVQFKANVTNEQSIAQEMVAFANTKGGTILIGVDDKTWDIIGLTDDDLRRLTNLLVNASSRHVKEPIFIETDTIEYEGKKVLSKCSRGNCKNPIRIMMELFYENGANKRKVTSNEEISRLLQSSGYLYAEEKL